MSLTDLHIWNIYHTLRKFKVICWRQLYIKLLISIPVKPQISYFPIISILLCVNY